VRACRIDVAGPPSDEGLMNCNALANGWLWTNVITEEAKACVRQVHGRQWGGGGGAPRDK
jgi:hypothetical protein